MVTAATWLGRLFRVVEIDDQVEACRRVFASGSLGMGIAILPDKEFDVE